MLVILDDMEGRRAFRDPQAVITAATPAQLPAALAALEAALAAGCHVAGWLAYELGYALEPRLIPLLPQEGMSLLSLGVFDEPVAGLPPPSGRGWA